MNTKMAIGFYCILIGWTLIIAGLMVYSDAHSNVVSDLQNKIKAEKQLYHQERVKDQEKLIKEWDKINDSYTKLNKRWDKLNEATKYNKRIADQNAHTSDRPLNQ